MNKRLQLLVLTIALPWLLGGCIFTANQASRKVRILNPNLLIISDLATDNYGAVQGARIDSTVPLSGIPSAIRAKGGGIMSAGEIEIVSATGGTVIIERGVSGNAGVIIPEALDRLFKPTFHPFGNITVDDGSAMREHVVDEPN